MSANLVQQFGHAANSIVKTTLLRQDRLSNDEVAARLRVCEKCPSGFARFRNGKVRSCGKMLLQYQSKNRKGKPCGCLLRYKARDGKEDCPMDHWPKLQSTPQSAPGSTPGEQARDSGIERVGDQRLETLPSGRTRRTLDVAQRVARLQERRQRLVLQNLAAGQGSAVHPADVSFSGDLSGDPNEFSLYDFFQRVVVVNLDRRSDRLDQFHRHLAKIDWPFRSSQRFRAVDGQKVTPPGWWQAGRGAWGCHRSHVQLIEQTLMDDVQTLLVLEDDVCFDHGLRDRLVQFLESVPDDWQQLYLGGQHLKRNRQVPQPIGQHVVRPYNVNRTHAYALHRRGMERVYRWLTVYPQHAKDPAHHVDHRLGELHASGNIKVYAPTSWIAGQSAGHSNIRGASLPSRFWNGKRRNKKPNCWAADIPFVAVIGLHRSGSSCMAGVLHKLGVHMGARLGGYEPTGGFEGVGLARLCERAYPFPGTELNGDVDTLVRDLRQHINSLHRSAQRSGKIAGGKYPHLCAMGNELKAISGPNLKVIHIDRRLDESIASLKTRSHKSSGWLGITDQQCEQVQRWLWDSKTSFLSQTEHLTVAYPDLLADPLRQIDRIIGYLNLQVTDDQRQQAADHVQPGLRRHQTQTNSKKQNK